MVTENERTDYTAELARTGEDIAALEASLAQSPRDIEKQTRLAYRLYHRATLTENPEAYRAAEIAIVAAISQFGPQEDLCLLKANLDLRFHRLKQAAEDLRMAPKLPGRFEARSIEADIAFQLGRYEEARATYEALIQENCTWDNLARLAHFEWKMGDAERADQLYVEAADDLTAKQMRSFAWIELQRGVIDIERGSVDEAAAHYRRAERAYSGYWLIDEHTAEALAAGGKFDAAVSLYRRVIERTPKPDLFQTLGELYVFIGKTSDAEPWFDRALAAYLESAAQGEVHYFHHLADFYADVRRDGAEAVKWARKDLELRENFSTQAALAWALYRSGAIGEALRWMHRALDSGATGAELAHQAAAICEAAGKPGHPHDTSSPERFHVHR